MIPADTQLAPGAPFVISRDLTKFQALHPDVNAIGPFGFGLSGSADSVKLFDATGNNSDPDAWGAPSAPFGTPSAPNSLSP